MEFPLLPNARLAASGLYRSAALHNVPPEVLAQFTAETGLRTVIDLRTTDERERDHEGAFPSSVELLHIPLFDTIEPHWENPEDQSASAIARRYVQMYEAGRTAIGFIAKVVEDADALPVLIHCMAGRDRTGIVMAHLLALRRVPDDAIAADYALSNASTDTMRAFLRFARETASFPPPS